GFRLKRFRVAHYRRVRLRGRGAIVHSIIPDDLERLAIRRGLLQTRLDFGNHEKLFLPIDAFEKLASDRGARLTIVIGNPEDAGRRTRTRRIDLGPDPDTVISEMLL